MSLYILHPQTVTTPSYSSSLLKTRNVSTPILPRYCTTRPLTIVDRQSLRAVLPVQNVQRSEKAVVLQQPIEELLGLGTPGEHPVRKRERLNHLTAEEKQNRRKLKNRVAAQTARDRKKYRASKLEEAVRMLILENGKLREENKSLKKTCEELKGQNVQLQAEGTGDDAFIADFNAFLSSDEMQELIGEICAADGTDSTLQDADGTTLGFERFCSKILSEIDNTIATSDIAESKTSKNCSARPVDCTTPDIIIAPEYLKSDPEYQTPISACADTANDKTIEYMEPSSCVNWDLESGHELKCKQSPRYSSCDVSSRNFVSTPPSFTFFDDMKEENNDASSPLISDNDPMFCDTHKWDFDDDYI
uniref:X-box-binding protein 1 n=1 Tax=Elaeophora elaphi TaxID=1147741 RepID=A0A0R3S0S1_9BILA